MCGKIGGLSLAVFAGSFGSLGLMTGLSACSSSADSDVPTSTDAGTSEQSDAKAPRDVVKDSGGDATSTGSDRIPANDYCETIADSFCDFYLRCDRMVVASNAECHDTFLETCNARYEARYVDLETAGLLTLSRAGVDACAAHLATVTCEEQPSDLLGPCGSMWIGTSAPGDACGVDVESFVCAPGATCVLDLSFCGTCQVAAARGEACTADVRCGPEDVCIEGTCVARGLPGQACDDTHVCISGGACTAGKCVVPAIVGEGEACGSSRRCAYNSFCDSGECKRSSLLGGPCTADRECASGRCESAKCVPLHAAGDACASAAVCSSAYCSGGQCASLPTTCIRP